MQLDVTGMDTGSIIGIVGIVITAVIAVYAMRDVREQVKGLITLERNRAFVKVRNDMVWLFVEPTECAHSVEIAKGLEEFNVTSVALDPKQSAEHTNSVVNNAALVFAEKLVKTGYATWKPGWDMDKVTRAIDGWTGKFSE